MVTKWPFLVLFLHQVITKIGALKVAEDASEFLYLGMNDSYPVIEYEGAKEPDPTRPEFLYSADAGPRVVEFYAIWCPHVSIRFFPRSTFRVQIFSHLRHFCSLR
jgi:hypothetical protein